MKLVATKEKETKTAKRKRLIIEACELEQEMGFIEGELVKTISEIMELNPTKKELDEGLKDLVDQYYWGEL